MKIEIQKTDWMEFVYNKIKDSKIDEVVSNIYLSVYKIEGVKDRENTIKTINIISWPLEQFLNNVTPLFLDSIKSLSYTKTQARDYIENVQKIKGWYDKGLFGEVVENKFPVGAPQQIPQAHQL